MMSPQTTVIPGNQIGPTWEACPVGTVYPRESMDGELTIYGLPLEPVPWQTSIEGPTTARTGEAEGPMRAAVVMAATTSHESRRARLDRRRPEDVCINRSPRT